MFNTLRTLFGPKPSGPVPAIPAGERVYAVGDIHGRCDLFKAMTAAIDADDQTRGPAQTTVVLLGDLIDRGPDSAGVVKLARAWSAQRHLRILLGNHEEMLLEALESEEVLRNFLRFGGRETVLSYMADHEAYHQAELTEALALIRAALPQGDLAFIRSFEDIVTIGDYVFVHAGVRPDVPLDQQRRADLRWIREPFLSHSGSFGPVVVHGHTIFDQPRFGHNRIGIDTGAYRTGRLTALALEGTARWLIEATVQDGAARTAQRGIA